ncbi:vWA domain-containing protein [Microscilla marina]|uniref:von Willebrand factor, type A n=1 Tax=Microscilla marina ATCC 23134 TaxID=313606 RepID=A1ZUW0_MICM2|nr:VWA domain-containing protein [Microscilla marina]EAY25864.1 von Willebrand factor, type A [Microscilla marina ATCC 23134]
MNKTLQFEAHLENKYWLTSHIKQELFVYLSLKGGKAPEKQERIPLNISLVVDRSGSMSGDKLNYVKKAVDFVIDNLKSDDVLSIVQYDDEIDVVASSAKVTNKKALHEKVKGIQARNMTNLSGGMMEGYAQVKSTQSNGYVNRVLLLSDGLANAGITAPEQLQQIAQKKFREAGIALSTFGVGSDFNEVLMTNLSEYGGANYYFIDMPDKIPQIFAQELEGLLSVVAQNTTLEVVFPQSYLKCTQVYGFPANISPDKVSVNFNDVVAEEEKAVLIKFEVIRTPDEPFVLKTRLQYDDVIDKMERITDELDLRMELTTDEHAYRAGINAKVHEQTALFTANDLFEQAIKVADGRDFEKAKQIIAQAKASLDAYFKLMPPSEELKKQYDSIVAYGEKLDQMKNMSQMDYMMSQKMSRSANYMARKKK